MTLRRHAVGRIGSIAAGFAAAVMICAWLMRPFDGGPADTDGAAAVLFFDRIVSGQHLEAYVNSTPKPLLTLVYGGLHALTGDWRPGAWVSVLVVAAAIVMAAELVRRVAGLEGAIFAGVALIGSAALLNEATRGHGLPWAFALWLAAGLALSRPVPRYGLAGVFLLLATLVRPETFIFLAVATGALAWRVVRGPRPSRPAGLILIGWLGLVVICAHDLLLTGDPLWWTKVAPLGVAGRRVASVTSVVMLNVRHLREMEWLLVAGTIGAIVLVWRRSWLAFLGLTAMGPLIAVFTVLVASRGLTVLVRYLHPIDLAVILAAAVGVGAMLAAARRSTEVRVPRMVLGGVPAIGAALAVLLAVVLSVPFAPTSAAARGSIGVAPSIALRLDSVVPILERALLTIPSRDVLAPGPYAFPQPGNINVFVPLAQANRLAVILHVPVSRLGWLEPDKVDLAAGYPSIGSLVYIDRALDAKTVTDKTAVLRPTVPTIVGDVRVVPIFTDPAAGIWIERIEAAPKSAIMTSARRPALVRDTCRRNSVMDSGV